jgi:hypothetical protein
MILKIHSSQDRYKEGPLKIKWLLCLLATKVLCLYHHLEVLDNKTLYTSQVWPQIQTRNQLFRSSMSQERWMSLEIVYNLILRPASQLINNIRHKHNRHRQLTMQHPLITQVRNHSHHLELVVNRTLFTRQEWLQIRIRSL